MVQFSVSLAGRFILLRPLSAPRLWHHRRDPRDLRYPGRRPLNKLGRDAC